MLTYHRELSKQNTHCRPIEGQVFKSLLISIVFVFLSGCAGLVTQQSKTGTSTTLSISVNSLPSAQMKQAYTATLTVTGGTAPFTWSVSSGSLPAGLSLSSAGDITGTPTSAGTSSFTVKVSDSSSPSQSATASLSITVSAAVQVSTSSLPEAWRNTAYSATLNAVGGTSPYTWSVSSGSWPAGLTLSSAGQITGTPNTAGTSSFTVKVTDSSSPAQTATTNLGLQVGIPVQVTTSSLPGGQTGSAYSSTLSASGGTAPYTWAVVSKSLPPGLTLGSSGQISGTPSAVGTSSFTVKVTDSSSPTQNATAALSVSITGTVTPVQITTSSLPGGQTGTSYITTLAASGGTVPYTWSLNGGSLPAGLTLSSSGQISGTPTAAGTSSFSVKVSDSTAPAQTATANLSITIASSVTAVQITTSSLPGGETGSSYSAALAATGGTAPYTWSLNGGSLPAGLSLSSSGQLSGTPTATGTSSFTIKVMDSGSPAENATSNLSITISTAGSGSATLVICPNIGQVGNKANCVASPTLTFGKQGTNTASAALGVSVNNCSTSAIAACSGSGSLTLASPYYTLAGPNASDFAVTTSGTCANGSAVASGSYCTLVIRFTPTQASGTNESATLTIGSDAQNGSQSLGLSGTSATVTQVSGCQSLNGNTNYQLISNVAASGSCFTVGQSSTDINLNGFTVSYCNSSSSSYVGGVFMDNNGVQSTTVHNGTINEGSGNCSGLVGPGYGSGAVVASSAGSSSTSVGTSLFNLNISVGTNIGSAKVLLEENGGDGSSLGTMVHDVIYNDYDTKSCGSVGCRDQDQGYPVVIDQSGHAGPTQFYNVIGTGGTQGGVVTTAANSKLTNNLVAPGNATSTLTNGFAFQDWGTNVQVENNLIAGTGPGGSCLSCRGVQVSSVNGQAVSGSLIQNNVFYTTNLANDVEYGGCQIDGSYGIQINTAGASQDLSNNTFFNNKVYVTSSVCPGFGFSWSGATAANGPNNTKSNTFSCSLAAGYTTGPCAGIRLDANQYNPGIAAVVGTGDTYIGDTSAIYIWYDGTPTWTCHQCTFSKGANPISNWVMLDYDGGYQSGQSSGPMYLVDPNFINGATKGSNNLAQWASNNSGLTFSYTVQWTYTVTVKGASSGNVISGATVTATDTQGTQECSGVTNASGQLACTLTDTKYGASGGNYTTTSANPFSVKISASGCTAATNNRTILSTTSETVSLPGC
jgi:Putative Ig domain